MHLNEEEKDAAEAEAAEEAKTEADAEAAAEATANKTNTGATPTKRQNAATTAAAPAKTGTPESAEPKNTVKRVLMPIEKRSTDTATDDKSKPAVESKTQSNQPATQRPRRAIPNQQ